MYTCIYVYMDIAQNKEVRFLRTSLRGILHSVIQLVLLRSLNTDANCQIYNFADDQDKRRKVLRHE